MQRCSILLKVMFFFFYMHHLTFLPQFPVITGLKETEERYYLLVRESRSFREAAASCQLRGGSLATPTTSSNNRLMAACINEASLSAVFIGLQASGSDLVRETVRHRLLINVSIPSLLRLTFTSMSFIFLSSGGIKQPRGRPLQPPAEVHSLELTGGRFENISECQLELCAAAQQWNVESSGVWDRHVFPLRVPQEQEARRKRSPAFILAGWAGVEK